MHLGSLFHATAFALAGQPKRALRGFGAMRRESMAIEPGRKGPGGNASLELEGNCAVHDPSSGKKIPRGRLDPR